MGDCSNIWIGREYREGMSTRLRKRLVFLALMLGMAVFLLFLGGLMWALIASNKNSEASMENTKIMSYAFFGTSFLFVVVFSLCWMRFVSDVKKEYSHKQSRFTQRAFTFPNEHQQEHTHSTIATPTMESRQTNFLDDINTFPQDLQLPIKQSLSETKASEVQIKLTDVDASVAVPMKIPEPISRPIALSTSSTPPGGSDNYMRQSSSTSSLQASEIQLHKPLTQRPRAISHSEMLETRAQTRSRLSRPSSVTTTSSKERLVVSTVSEAL